MTSTAGVRLIAVALLGCSLPACNVLSECENSVISQTTNPSGDRTAVAFARSCGATTSDTFQVSVGDGPNYTTNDKGNIVIIENPTRNGRRDALAWKGDRTLEVTVPEGEETFLKLDKYDDVQIIYR